MNIETKAFDIKMSTVDDESKGRLHAVVSVFGNVDSVGDVMVKGAFAKSIASGKEKGKLPPGVWSHDWERPCAKTLDAFETDEGLNIIAQFNLETQDGRDAYSNIKNGLFTEYSFGFARVKGGDEAKDGKNYVSDLNWFEWSPVLVGANRETYTVGVKQYNPDELISYSDMEKRLRDVGLSQKAAKIWVSGFKALHQRDVEVADEPEAPPPIADEPEPPPPMEAETAPEAHETEIKQEQPTQVAPVAVVVLDVAGLLHQQKVQALYQEFQATKDRLKLR